MENHAITLPIDHEDGLKLDAAEALSLGQLLSEDYAGARPFPHIVLDEFIPDSLMQKVLHNFPVQAVPNEAFFDTGYAGHHKRQVFPEDCNAFCRQLFHFFNSKPVLQFLEGLTGIQGLIPDPYFMGGGFHETSKGGKLGIHADFRVNDQLHLQRRLNLLIYLNPEWQDDWYGQLELWDRDMKQCVKKISPVLNRAVVFNTESDTWHGHPDPLATPDGVTRRSIALYYYTASKEIYTEVPTINTLYRARPADPASIKIEAGSSAFVQYLRQCLPPVLLREFYKMKRGIQKSRQERLMDSKKDAAARQDG